MLPLEIFLECWYLCRKESCFGDKINKLNEIDYNCGLAARLVGIGNQRRSFIMQLWEFTLLRLQIIITKFKRNYLLQPRSFLTQVCLEEKKSLMRVLVLITAPIALISLSLMTVHTLNQSLQKVVVLFHFCNFYGNR